MEHTAARARQKRLSRRVEVGREQTVTRALRRIVGTLQITALAPFVLAACDEFGPRIYSAYPYRTEEQCLEPSVVLAVVHADELPATCAPVCLSFEAALYVSTICAPYPTMAILVAPEEDVACAAAIGALTAEAICDTGGGADAGAGEAGPDASVPDAGPIGGGDSGMVLDAAAPDATAAGPLDAGLSVPDGA
ncbi:MAG: hypothetical protein ABW217_13395 [Polyangiaceae bacterium]